MQSRKHLGKLYISSDMCVRLIYLTIYVAMYRDSGIAEPGNAKSKTIGKHEKLEKLRVASQLRSYTLYVASWLSWGHQC